MRRRGLAAAAILCCALTVSGCGLFKAAGKIGRLFGAKKTSTVTTIVKIIGTVLGQFYDTTTKKALVGSWIYEEPAIQFESQNLLDQAGGVVASQSVADNITPYFEKLGLKTGGLAIDLREDNTCTFTIAGQTIDGTYEFGDETKKLSLKAGFIPLPPAYLSIVNNQMAMTYDSSMLLNIVRVVGEASSSQSSLASVAKLADSYDGMKTGFTFKKSR
ncbi:MAG: DUF4923 family protein [Bacteroidales bacterium]|nr:DUF4923 family protein [Bacteroidales bacterium]